MVKDQERQHLDGLAEPHVVGEAAAEAQIAQEDEPSKAGALIGPQLAAEALGLGSGAGAPGRAQADAQLLEFRVGAGARAHLLEQQVDHRRLRGPQLGVAGAVLAFTRSGATPWDRRSMPLLPEGVRTEPGPTVEARARRWRR